MGLYEKLGAITAGRLICESCGRMLKADKRAVSFYMRDGWPSCCGYTMTLKPARPTKPEEPKP